MMNKTDFKPSSLDQRVERALAAKGRTHFSRTDWDFADSNWTLDETIYHAAAPSLRGTSTGKPALIKNATTGALSDGRLIAWLRSGVATYLPAIWFRNQQADGGASYSNTYLIYIYNAKIEFYYYLAGGGNLIDTHAHTWSWAAATWYKIRITWWSSADILWVRVERWDGDAWVTLGGAADVDFQDPDDRWKDETVNRCGFQYYSQWWVDDVEVWGV